MGNINPKVVVWSSSSNCSEELLIYLSTLMFKDMFFSYVLPLTKRLIPSKYLVPPRKIEWVKKRKYVASHVKTAFDKVKVFVVSSEHLCNELVAQRMLKSSKINFIGLDCEWDSAKKNGVALIQVSSGSDCILYRSSKTNGILPENLKKLLEDRKILKFGVAIQEDARRLRAHGVQIKGFVDLRNLAQRCVPVGEQIRSDQEEEMFQWTSLRSLSYHTLGMKLNKNHHIRCGDWEAASLSNAQILYAAKDAIVSLEIFYALVLLRKVNQKPNSTLTILSEAFVSDIETVYKWLDGCFWDSLVFNVRCYSHKEDHLCNIDTILPSKFSYTKPSTWLTELAHSLCQGIVDVNHKPRPPVGLQNSSFKTAASSRAFSTKAAVGRKPYKHSCRDKPLYENCFLVGPDKKVLATVNRSKAQWYVHKGLGEVEAETPFTVRLLFEPSGRPMPDADYYTTVKENVCVVCGSTESFVRKMIIPHDYRKYFPLKLKDHMSHDVLLMCLDCHRTAQMFDEELRQQLSDKYNAPFGTNQQMLFIDNPDLGKVRSAAKALANSVGKIPEQRRKQLEDIVQKHYKTEEVTEALLKEAINLNVKEANKAFAGRHGERVVRAVLDSGTLPDFVRLWRQRFLDKMRPRFLPPMWSVEHNLHKLMELKDEKPHAL